MLPLTSTRSKNNFGIVLLAGTLWTLSNATLIAESPEFTSNLLLLSSSQSAQQRLSRPAGNIWQQRQLRGGLQDLEREFQISIWLDRRIDPNQLVDHLPTEGGIPTLLQMLRHIASQVDAEVGLVGSVVYFGPAAALPQVQFCAQKLHHDREQLAVSGSGVARSRNAQLKPLHWEDIVTPQEVLDSLSSNWEEEIVGEIPHDLMHAGSVQLSTLETQVALLASGFGLGSALVNGKITLTAMPASAEWKYLYNPNDLDLQQLDRRRLAKTFADFRKRGYQVALKQSTSGILVTGPTEFHLGLLSSNVAPVAKTDVSLLKWPLVEVQNQTSELFIRSLGASVGLEVIWDAAIDLEQRKRLVTFTIRDANFQQILDTYSRQAGLRVTYDDDSIRLNNP